MNEKSSGLGMLANENDSKESGITANKQNDSQVFTSVPSLIKNPFADDSASAAKRCKVTPFCKFMNKLSFNPDNSGTQVALGGATGWLVGYIANKVGRTAAIALGGGFLIIQIAHQCGYLTIDWKKVNQDMDKAQQRLFADDHREQVGTVAQKMKVIVKKNTALTVSFTGGFFIGIAT